MTNYVDEPVVDQQNYVDEPVLHPEIQNLEDIRISEAQLKQIPDLSQANDAYLQQQLTPPPNSVGGSRASNVLSSISNKPGFISRALNATGEAIIPTETPITGLDRRSITDAGYAGSIGGESLRSAASGATFSLSEPLIQQAITGGNQDLINQDIAQRQEYMQEAPLTNAAFQIVGAASPGSLANFAGRGASELGAAASEKLAEAGLPKFMQFAGRAGTQGTLGAVTAGGGQALTEAGLEAAGLRDKNAPSQVKNAAKIGGYAGVGAEAVQSGVNAAQKLFKGFATNRTLSAMGARAGNLPDSIVNQGEKRAAEVSEYALKNKLVQGGDDFSSIAQKSQEAKDEVWNEISQLHDDVSNKLNDPAFLETLAPADQAKIAEAQISPQLLNDKIIGNVKDKFKGKAGFNGALKRFQNLMNDVSENEPVVNLAKANSIKSDLDSNINFKVQTGEDSLVNQMLKEARRDYQSAIEDQVGVLDKFVGGRKVQRLKELNKEYGLAADVNHIAKKRSMSEKVNNIWAPSTKLAAALGAIGGGALAGSSGDSLSEKAVRGGLGMLTGVATGLANAGGRRYLMPALTSGAYGASTLPVNIPSIAAQAIPALTPVMLRKKAMEK